MVITDEQIEELQSLRLDAVVHINASLLHNQKVKELADQACEVLGLDPSDKTSAANIVRGVVKFGTDPADAISQIIIDEANRQFNKAGNQ